MAWWLGSCRGCDGRTVQQLAVRCNWGRCPQEIAFQVHWSSTLDTLDARQSANLHHHHHPSSLPATLPFLHTRTRTRTRTQSTTLPPPSPTRPHLERRTLCSHLGLPFSPSSLTSLLHVPAVTLPLELVLPPPSAGFRTRFLRSMRAHLVLALCYNGLPPTVLCCCSCLSTGRPSAHGEFPGGSDHLSIGAAHQDVAGSSQSPGSVVCEGPGLRDRTTAMIVHVIIHHAFRMVSDTWLGGPRF